MRLRELIEPKLPKVSSQFRKWFGTSEIRDRFGRPRVVYHGTARVFDQFDLAFSGTGSGDSEEKAIFFSFNPDIASHYAGVQGADYGYRLGIHNEGVVYPAYVRMERPYFSKMKFYRIKDMIQEIAQAKHAGYDGIIFDKMNYGSEADTLCVFDPDQVWFVYRGR